MSDGLSRFLVDACLADMAASTTTYLARREAEDFPDTFVIQVGRDDRLRLSWPVPRNQESLVEYAQAVQNLVANKFSELVPLCPLHNHALTLTPVGATHYEWACPSDLWRCVLGFYGEKAWPNLPDERLASLLGSRMRLRHIEGVRSFDVELGGDTPIASFTVESQSIGLLHSLAEVAAPLSFVVHIEIADPEIPAVSPTHLDTSEQKVRLVSDLDAIFPGQDLKYCVSNEGDVPILTGLDFTMEFWDGDLWAAVNSELGFPAIGMRTDPGQKRAFSAGTPANLQPGLYRLKKGYQLIQGPRRSDRPRTVLADLTCKFRVIARECE